jgi:hypothetical protein
MFVTWIVVGLLTGTVRQRKILPSRPLRTVRTMDG